MMPTSRRHYLAAFLFCAVQTLGACSSCDGDNNATTSDDMSNMTDDGGNMPGDMGKDSDTTDPDSDTTAPDMPNPVDGDMDTMDDGGAVDMDMDMNPGGEVVTCATPIPAPAAGSLCSATAGTGSNVVLRGTVLAEDGKIYAVDTNKEYADLGVEYWKKA